jgi:hypothetical protein
MAEPRKVNTKKIAGSFHNYLEKMVNEALLTKYKVAVLDQKMIQVAIWFKHANKEIDVRFWIGTQKDNSGNKKKVKDFYLTNNFPEQVFRTLVLKKIKQRIKGADAEIRGLKILRRMKANRRYGVIDIYTESQYADNVQKMDLVFVVQRTTKSFFKEDQIQRYVLGVNVKSSKAFQNMHKDKYPDTPSIEIMDDISDYEIEKKFATIIDYSVAFHTALNLKMSLQSLSSDDFKDLPPENFMSVLRAQLHQ